ncbi:hypothetical protein B566_EDAN016424 [Ephemera danica]|nr:hypothetical protein B566_EDAN016424 [Ephemera danica]
MEELYEGLEKNNVLSYWTNAHNDGILQTLKTKEERREMAEEIGQVLTELKKSSDEETDDSEEETDDSENEN